MFVFAKKKANICRTLGPKNEHYPFHLTCRPNIANSAVGHNKLHTTVGHNKLHTTLRWELISGGMGNVITCYNKAAHTHDATRADTQREQRNWFQEQASKIEGKKKPRFCEAWLVGRRFTWLVPQLVLSRLPHKTLPDLLTSIERPD